MTSTATVATPILLAIFVLTLFPDDDHDGDVDYEDMRGFVDRDDDGKITLFEASTMLVGGSASLYATYAALTFLIWVVAISLGK